MAGQKARIQTNDPKMYGKVRENMEPFMSCIAMPEGRNAKFGRRHLNRSMMYAAMGDSSVGGGASAVKDWRGREAPSDRWVVARLKSADAKAMHEMFMDSVRQKIEELRDQNKIPRKGLPIAADMHKIARFDKRPGPELTRSKYDRGTKYFERYITVSCTAGRARITLGAAHLRHGDSVPDALRNLLKTVQDAGVRISELTLDLEFFSVESIRALQESGVKFLMPCPNTTNVVSALNEYAQKRRGRVSENVIKGEPGSATYQMIITKRKSKKAKEGGDAKEPKDRYIGFATNDPDIDLELYDSRWGIEITYKLVEETRAKTRITCLEAKMFCFYYSLLVYNERMMLRMICEVELERQSRVTQEVFKYGMAMLSMPDMKPPT